MTISINEVDTPVWIPNAGLWQAVRKASSESLYSDAVANVKVVGVGVIGW